MTDLTERQERVRQAMITLTRKKGRPISKRELAEHVGLRTPQSVQAHINALMRKGAVEADPDKARGLRAVNADQVRLIDASAEIQRDEAVDSAERTIDWISATLADLITPRPTYFVRCDAEDKALRARKGDIIAIRAEAEVEDGDTVLARIDNRLSYRRAKRTSAGGIELSKPGAGARERVEIPDIAWRLYIEGVIVGKLRASGSEDD